MLGQSLLTGAASNNRVFVYEVEGLRQTEQTTSNSYPVRNSSKFLIQVPYNRMNEEMLRIGRMGGKIVNIRPLSEPEAPTKAPSSESKE